MKNNKTNTSRFIFLLAVISFLVATVEGAVYYEKYAPFFRILLVLQNSINAFGFKATITLKDAFAYMKDNNSAFSMIIAYAYGIAVFTAPYCTLSFIYKFLERLLQFIVFFRRNKNCRHIVVFGFNDDVRAMLKNGVSDRKKTCVHIVSAEKLSGEEIYALNKQGYVVHCADLLKADESDIPSLVSKMYLEKAENIILFEKSSVRNFSLLQLFRLTADDSEYRVMLPPGSKVSCRCEEEGISRLISSYYNSTSGSEACFDLEIIGLPEMQVRKMYSDCPLHTVYRNTGIPLKDWNVHLLVAGLGKLGEEAVIQAMNLGVVHEQNRIVIDVFDSSIVSKKAVFLNQFSRDTFDITDDRVVLKSDVADGVLEINFFEMNVSHIDFYDTVRERSESEPYTYAVIALEDTDLAVNCAIQLEELFAEKSVRIPILMRLDNDRRLAEYIADENGSLTDVRLIDDRRSVITLDMITGRNIDCIAKEYNHFYNSIALLSADESGSDDNSAGDSEKEWNKLRLFRRSSSKAAAYHDEVKNDVIPELAAENGTDLSEKLEEILGRNGTLMK